MLVQNVILANISSQVASTKEKGPSGAQRPDGPSVSELVLSLTRRLQLVDHESRHECLLSPGLVPA
jgi:hypothetical protein